MAEFDGTVADFFAHRQSVQLMGLLQTVDAVLFGGTQPIAVLTDSSMFSTTTPAPTAATTSAMYDVSSDPSQLPRFHREV